MAQDLLAGSRERILLEFFNKFIVPLFISKGYTLPKNIRISVGLMPSKNAVGVTFHPTIGDNYFHIYIAAQIARDVYEVFGTLIHECIHTLYFDHLKDFSQCAAAVGLVKPWTSTTNSAKLDNDIDVWMFANNISWYEPALHWLPGGSGAGGGTLPCGIQGPGLGGGFGIGSPKPQPARMIKLTCPTCGYIIRTSRSNIISKGLPICPDGTEFQE